MQDEKFLDYFKELCSIPHASFDEARVGDWLMDFAQKRSLECRRDEIGNVVIKKPSTVPGCKAPAVMLQGHMDMVYVRTPDCKHAYEDGIKPIIENGFITADGTSLGADDGIAVAYALAVLDSDNIKHPDLEVVITVQEEVGLGGAEALDCSDLKAKYILNLDSEDEGNFCTGCASAVRNDMVFHISREKYTGQKLTVKIGGLKGGHSGAEIQYGRPNAIMLMFSALLSFGGLIHIDSIVCDGKTNAIATDCEAVIYVDPEKTEKILSKFASIEKGYNEEFAGKDEVKIIVEQGGVEQAQCWDSVSHRAALGAYVMLPNGVRQEEDTITVCSCLRSSNADRKRFVINQLDTLAGMAYGESICSGDYPMWEFDPNSRLRPLAMDSYKELFGKDATYGAIHAGLECGYFAQKMPGVDIISFGPDQIDIHTTRERVGIDSAKRVWQLLCSILEKLSK